MFLIICLNLFLFIDPCLPSGDPLPYQVTQKMLDTESPGHFSIVSLSRPGAIVAQGKHSVDIGQMKE